MSNQRMTAMLLDRLYETALDRGRWQEVLDPLTGMLGGTSAWLSQQDVTTGSGSGFVWGMDPAVQAAYFEQYYGFDLVSLRGSEVAAAGPVLTDAQRVPRDTLLRSTFYNEFMGMANANSILMIDLGVDAGLRSVIHINRPRRHPSFDIGEVGRARRLLPHLRRAMHVSNGLGGAAAKHADLALALDANPAAVLLLDREGRLVHANTSGLALLAAATPLRLSHGRLYAVDPALADPVAAAIKQACAHDPALRRATTIAMAGDKLCVSPLGDGPAPGRAAVMLSLAEAGVAAPLTSAGLRDRYGMTPAEARVALLLVQGLTPRQIGERLGTQLQTVRNQMRRIFEKAGVSRQSALIRLLIS